MQLIDTPPALPLPPLAATIGFFDGVHRGHRFLIEQVRQTAAARDEQSALVTFARHPRQVLQSDYRPYLLSTPDEKLALLGTTGAAYCILLPFTPELSRLSARAFMERLHKVYNIRSLVIGYDHRFGHNRSETFEDYRRYGDELHIYIERAREFECGAERISSSTVRRLLGAGNVRHAARLLGYPYAIEGTVGHGRQVGRRIGFPTANLVPGCPDKLVPADGVYAVRAVVAGNRYDGMLNIGRRPTLDNGSDRTIEAHLIGFAGDLYGQPMRIEFIDYLRPEEKYDTLAGLVAQMGRDREEAVRVLSGHGK